MVNRCCVRGCKAEFIAYRGLTFHEFPKNPSLYREWVKATGRERGLVCSQHFQPSDFRGDDLTSLIKDAVPTVALNSSVQTNVQVKTEQDEENATLPSSWPMLEIAVPRLIKEETTVHEGSDLAKTEPSKIINKYLCIAPVQRQGKQTLRIGVETVDETVEVATESGDLEWSDQVVEESGKTTENDEEEMLVEALESETEDDDNCQLLACRVCLETTGYLFPLSRRSLVETFTLATGLDVREDDGLPQHLCMECLTKLRHCEQFRMMSRRAFALMTVLGRKEKLTMKSIKQANRQRSGLVSNLTTKHFDSNHFDVCITTEEELCKDESHETVDEPKEFSNVKYLEEIFGPVKEEYVIEKEEYAIDNYTEAAVEYEVPENYILELGMNENGEINTVDQNSLTSNNTESDENFDKHFVKQILSVEEQISEIEKRKESRSYLTSKYKCEYCCKGCNDETSFNEHMEKHTDVYGPLVCPVCQLHFSASRGFSLHRQKHERKYVCKTCGQNFSNKQAARRHMAQHDDKTVTCEFCGANFGKYQLYLAHVRMKHPSEHVCCLCGLSFHSEKSVNAHLTHAHTGEVAEIPEWGPSCDECTIRFKSLEALHVHLKVSPRHKPPPQEQNTEEDDVTIVPAKSKQRRGKSLKCEQCGIEIADPRQYRFHFSTAHPHTTRTWYPNFKKPIICELCGKILQCPATYKYHMMRHEGKLFPCHICSKQYKSKEVLNQHIKNHSVRYYPCGKCDKVLTSAGNRHRHMKFAHTEDRNLECEYCSKHFKSKEMILQHINHVHLKKPWPKRIRSGRTARQPRLEVSQEQIEIEYVDYDP